MKKKILISSILSIMLCLSLISGATFALFTSESKVNIAVTSGKVEMQATIENLKTWSLEDDKTLEGRTDGTFTQGGYVKFENSVLSINKIIPGDKLNFDITGTNNSNVTILYRVIIKCLSGEMLMDGLEVTIDNETYKGLSSYVTSWYSLTEGLNMKTVNVSVELPTSCGNIYQDKTSELLVTVEAVQGNADMKDEKELLLVNYWDGSSDLNSLESNTNEELKLVEINTAEELAAFRDNVNSGVTYKDYLVKLNANIDLANYNFEPIGINADSKAKFMGTFDGCGHTIFNLSINQGAGYHAAGFFGALNGTLKNLNFENALVNNLSTGTSTDNGTAIACGSIYTNGSISNVHVLNSKVTSNRYVGGICGYAYGSIENCSVTNTTVKGEMDDLTGKVDNGDKVGGIVGYIAGEERYVLNNNAVYNCAITAERDVAGIAGVASALKEFENNKVYNTNIYYHMEKSYETASEIVSKRLTIDVPVTNYFENTFIILDVKTLDNLKDALNNKKDVKLYQDIYGPATDSNGYGSTGVRVNGSILDGNGYILNVSNSNTTWDSCISSNGGIIKNLTVEGAFRGIFTGGLKADLYLDNVLVDKVCYTFSADGTFDDKYSLIVTNSTFNGWTSYSKIFKEVKFTNCNFGKGTGTYQYAYLRPYNDTIFENCNFSEGYEFDSTKAVSTFVNCYVNGQLVTSENVTLLLGSSASNIIVNNN